MSTSTSSGADVGGDLLGCSPNEAKILEAMDSVCSTVARLIQWADRVIVDGKQHVDVVVIVIVIVVALDCV